MLERHLVLWEGADDVEQQPSGHDYNARRRFHRLELDAHAELHIRRLELSPPILHPDQNAGQCLNRATSGCTANSYGKPRQERFTGNGELQLTLPI